MNREVSWQPPLSIIVHQTSLKLFLFLLNDFINYFSSLKKIINDISCEFYIKLTSKYFLIVMNEGKKTKNE